jgi:hypothetical protein
LSGYAVAHLEEIDELDDGRCPWRPVRHHLGISAFGINAWTARDVGDRIINEHDESDDGSEELYLVTGGRAVFELDGERLDAPAGMLVFVRSGVKRTAFAEEPGTTIVAVGGVPGKAYEPVGWEVWAPLRPLYEAGYNLACCESLAGRTTDAIEHLRQAIGRSEQFRAHAKEDSDFDPIRDEPAFKELIGG